MPEEEPRTITPVITKSPDKVVYATGVFGGLDPSEGRIIFYLDRLVPKMKEEAIAEMVTDRVERLFFHSPIHDHQCGFKRSSAFGLINEVHDVYWFWDTEVIVKALKRGYVVIEVPVMWTDGRASKVHLLKDTKYMGLSILKLWWHLSKREHPKS